MTRSNFATALCSSLGCLSVASAALLSAAFTSSCGTSDSTPAEVLYTTDTFAHGTALQYALPLTASSMSRLSFSEGASSYVATDSAGNLVVGNALGSVSYFTAPLAETSMPIAKFALTSVNEGQSAFGPDGAIYTSDIAGGVEVFTPPFSDETSVSSTITAPGLAQNVGTAFDSTGNLYVTSIAPTAGSQIFVFAPPYTGTPLETTATSGSYGQLTIAGSQLFVCNTASGSLGKVDVYTLPLTTASGPAFSITTDINVPAGVAFDTAGNLYVSNPGSSSVNVFAPPFSATSAATTTLSLNSHINGIAIAK